MNAKLTAAARGGGFVGAIASVVVGVVLLIGVLDGATPLIFLGGSIGAGVYGLALGKSADRWFVAGALVAGATIAMVGALSGNVWLSYGGIIGASVGTIAGNQLVRLGGVHIDIRIVAAAICLAVAAFLVPLVVSGGTLDHDESAYALKAKSWLEDVPDTGYGIHRGPAMWGYGYVIQAMGGEEPALRALGVISLLGLAAAVFWLGGLMGNRRIGGWAAVAIVASPPLLRRSTEFLSDIPAAAVLVVCMAIVWREFGLRDLPSYRLLWMLPLAWLAFYLRYQSLLSFALIVGTILMLWWPKVRARPGPLLASALFGLVGLIPHALFATSLRGSPIGILTWVTSAGRDFTGDGLLDYVGIFGWTMGLFLGPILVGLSGWWLVIGWHDGRQRSRASFLLAPALAQVLALGILGDAFERFVFFPYALLAVAGSIGLGTLVARANPAVRTSAFVGLVVLAFGVLSLAIAESRRYVEARSVRNEPLELASYEVANLSEGQVCAVATSYIPQVTFYSECASYAFIPGSPESSVDRLTGDARFAILIDDGKRQPSVAELETYEELSGGSVIVVRGERDQAVILIFDP